MIKKDQSINQHTLGKLAKAIVFSGWKILIWNVAFNCGSSKQGNACRAFVGWKSVANNFLK